MCQLTLISSSNNFPYKGILAYLLAVNSAKNQDGWGFFEPLTNTLYKVKESARLDDNLFTILAHLPTNNNVKIMGHVRLASGNKGSITDTNAHPYEKETLILAHNGTLTLKEGTLPTDMTDSEYFAGLLDTEYKKSLDMVSALQETYKLFDGKFAFLIYSKVEDKFYVARGSLATLWKTTVKVKHGNRTKSMFVVNTEKETLSEVLETSAYFLAYNQFQDDLRYSAPEMLAPNSIYTFNEDSTDLINIGVLAETVKVYVAPSRETAITPSRSRYNALVGGDYARIGKAMYRAGLSVTQMEKLLCIASDVHYIQDLREVDILKIGELIEKYYSTKKRKVWDRIVQKLHLPNEDDVYEKTGLEFPFFINDKVTLVEAWRKCLKITS